MRFINFKKLRLKTRFIYAFVSVIIITIAIISIANYYRWKHNYLYNIRNEELILTQTLTQGCINPILRNEFDILEAYANDLIKKADIVYLMIMDRHDRILVYKPDDLVEIPNEVNKKVKDNINPYLIQTYYNPALETKINDISVPVIIDSKKWGTVRVGFSLAHMCKEVARNILVVLVTGLISVFIGIIVALILGRFVTGPIEKCIHSMKMVAQGDLDEEVSIDSHDEFGILARSFNKMARALRKKEDELRETYHRLMQTEKLAVLGELIAYILHEIKNPLTIIKSSAQILADEKKNLEVRIKKVPSIIEGVNRIDIIITEILNIPKPKPTTFKKINLNDILEKTIQFCEPLILKRQKILVTRQFNRNIPHLFLDEEQIGLITLNMIINSCDAMPDGGELTISTDWNSQTDICGVVEENNRKDSNKLHNQNFVQVKFEDTGIGIPQNNLKKIFDTFFTTKEKGSGLGLSRVKRIVENYGGKIEVESKEGEGTKFTIFFPVTEME